MTSHEDPVQADGLAVAAAVRAVTADGTAHSMDALVASVVERMGGDPDVRAEQVWDAVEDTRYALLGDDVVVDVEVLVGGRVFTHRVSSAEADAQMLVVSPDLEVVIEPVLDTVPLRGGGVAALLLPGDDAVPERLAESEEAVGVAGAIAGPEGWLSGVADGDLVTVSLTSGTLTVERLGHAPGPGEAEAAAIDRGIAAAVRRESPDASGAAGRGPVSTLDVMVAALLADPDAFRVPPPPVGDLLPRCGLERRGEYLGPAGEAWQTPEEQSEAVRARHNEEVYAFQACCHEAFAVVEQGFFAALRGERPDGPAVAAALAHGAVAEAFAEDVLGIADDAAAVLLEFAGSLVADAPGPAAAAVHYLRAQALEGLGDAPAAEGALIKALAADQDHRASLEEAAWFAEDRGDAARAAGYLRRMGVPPADPQLARLAGHVAAVHAAAGRNDPCPCGSGRKHKRCCLGRPAPFPERAAWLYDKALVFAGRPRNRGRLLDLASVAADAGASLGEMLVDPLIPDLALFEGGLLEEFRDRRGPLLPADERDLVDAWAVAGRRLAEVVEARPDGSCVLGDLRSGEVMVVGPADAVAGAAPGDTRLVRVVPDGAGGLLVAGPAPRVPAEARDAIVDLIGSGPRAEEWAAWWGAVRDVRDGPGPD